MSPIVLIFTSGLNRAGGLSSTASAIASDEKSADATPACSAINPLREIPLFIFVVFFLRIALNHLMAARIASAMAFMPLSPG